MNNFKKLAIIAMAVVIVMLISSCNLIPGLQLPGGDEHTHEISEVAEVAATCTEAGAKAHYTCSECKKLFADAEGANEIDAPEVIEALGHSFTDYASDDNATCTADGTKTAQCDRCEEKDTLADAGSKLNHTYNQEVTTLNGALKSEADCTNAAVYYKSCSCGAISDTETFEDGTSLGHDYTEKVADETHLKSEAADCQTKDTYWYDCTRCNSISDEFYYNSEKAGAHSVSTEWTTADGKHFYECTVSGCDYVADEADCSDVLTDNDHKCDVCGAEGVTSHAYGDWEKVDENNHKKTCNCSDIVTEAHNWDDGVVTTNPSHTEDGEKTYTCTVCSETKTESVDKITECNYNQEKVDAKYLKSAATCTSPAVYYKSCVCGEFSNAEDAETFNNGDPIAHTYDQEVITLEGALKSAADCEKAAVYYKSCSCGAISDSETFESGAALGHDEQNHDAQEPTCENVGWDAYVTCSRCGYTTKVEKKPLSHDEESHEGQAATCTEKGWEAYVTCKREGCNYTTYKEIDALDHDWSGEVLESDGNYYKKCQNGCGETQAAEAPNKPDNYTAVLDNEYTSDKENTLDLIYSDVGAWGIATNGEHKVEPDIGSPETGATGGLDTAGKYLYYEFVMDEAGVVDFIWNIAGSNWNDTTQTNDGIADMANHMTVTIDGKPVIVNDITLPIGEQYIWWNLQNVVIKDVALEAGVHTFKCEITAAGGLNVGSMTIKSTKATHVRTAKAMSADLVQDGDNIYYVFTFVNNGFEQNEIKFWDETGDQDNKQKIDYPFASYETVDGITTVKIDVTNMEVGRQICPHMTFADINYVNGLNNNGDICGDQIDYKEKYITVNEINYILITAYDMPSLMISKDTMTISDADIILENDKVYYVLKYTCVGYDPSTVQFFDGDTVFALESYESNGVTVTFKINVTDLTAGTTLWPHLRIGVTNWDGVNNVESSNGDVTLYYSTNYNKVVELNGRTYTLVNQWNLPTVVVA